MLEPSKPRCTISCLAVVEPHQLFQFLALPDCNSSQHRKHKQWFIHAHLTVTFLSLGSLPHRSQTGQSSSSYGQHITSPSRFAFSPSAARGVAPVGIEVIPAQRKKQLSQESAHAQHHASTLPPGILRLPLRTFLILHSYAVACSESESPL